MKKAKLTFIFSSMNSGKSLALLTKNFMLLEKGFKTVLMKPSIDNRTTTISSRVGLKEKCIQIRENELITKDLIERYQILMGYDYYEKPNFILVDEAQFLSKEQIWSFASFVDEHNIDVLCYGLKLNWQGEFFSGSGELMKIADELIQMETYCPENVGATAMFHIKLGGSNDAVETGYENLYKSVSRKSWKRWRGTEYEKDYL